MTTAIYSRFGLAATVAAVLLASQAARAEEGVAIKNLLGSIGLIAPDKDPIRYRERAPLVVPPKMELRAPAGTESYASSNPQWPRDPDVVARQRRAAEEKIPVTDSEIRRMSERDPRLSIQEIRAGRGGNANAAAEPPRGKSDRDGVWIAPRELSAGPRPSSDEVATAEPMRRTLTDPPTALRKSAMGGEVKRDFQGKVDQQELDANPMTWLTRKFRSGDDDE